MIGSGLFQSLSARITALKMMLLDAATAGNGAGALGFLYATGYTGNTVGAWLKGLAASQGASFIGWIQAMTGATARTLLAKIADAVSVLDFAGVDPTGVADSTTGLQAAITATRLQSGDQRILLWRKGTYKVATGLILGSNQNIVFEQGVVINFTGDVNTSLFTASNQTCVYLYCNGAQINGNRAGVTLSDAGNQTAFFIYGSDNVLIQDANIANFAMDGITLSGDTGSSGPCTNVRLVGCDVSNSGRNGLSITHANGVLIEGGRYWGSNGTPSGPWAGIDIEPNTGEYAKAIVLAGVRTQTNAGAGLQFTPGAMSASAGLVYDVTVLGGRSTGDSAANGKPALYFANGGTMANEVYGQVVVRDFVVESPLSTGVGFQNWDATNAPRAILENVKVINPNAGSGSTGVPNQSGFVIYCSSAQAVTAMGKITMRNCKAQDNRGTAVMQIGCYIGADTGKTVQDVLIQDFTSINYLSASKYPVKTDLSVAGSFVDVVVTYANPKPVSSSASITDAGWGGQCVNLTTASTSFQLPLATRCKGLTYIVQCDQGVVGNCSVVITGTDFAKANGVAKAASITLQPGDKVMCRSLGGSLWNVSPCA